MDNGFAAIIFGGVFTDGDRDIRQVATSDLVGVRFFGSEPGHRAGFDVSSAGDFNQDGFGDILIAVPGAALIAGLTNVVTIRTDGLGTNYAGLGITGVNVHGIGHGATPQGFDSPDAARDKIRQCHIEQIAKLASKLKAVPEGDGTMLDNTTIIYFSDVGDKHHASNKQWPYIVIGNVGGKLKTAGRYIQYPGKGAAGHHTIANWWMTLLHAVGKPQDDFGMKDPNVSPADQKGPLAELLA